MKSRYTAPITWGREPELVVTPEQMDRARSNKAVGYIWMHTIDFLLLTTPSDAYIKHVIDEALPLESYNEFSRSGEISVPPFLMIDIDTGEVTGHEGRHRAASLFKLDPTAEMRVSIELYENDEHGRRHAIYYRELTSPPWTKTFLSVADIPKVLSTECFGGNIYAYWGKRIARVAINLEGAHNYWYDQARRWD